MVLSRKYAGLKYLKWVMVKLVPGPPIPPPWIGWPALNRMRWARWMVHEIIHARFMLMWSVDPTVLEQTDYTVDRWKDGPCLYAFRFQVVRFCFQFWMFRRPLWDRKGKFWDFPIKPVEPVLTETPEKSAEEEELEELYRITEIEDGEPKWESRKLK